MQTIKETYIDPLELNRTIDLLYSLPSTILIFSKAAESDVAQSSYILQEIDVMLSIRYEPFLPFQSS